MECAVLGLADETTGQKIIAIIKLRKANIDEKDFNGKYVPVFVRTVGLCICVYMRIFKFIKFSIHVIIVNSLWTIFDLIFFDNFSESFVLVENNSFASMTGLRNFLHDRISQYKQPSQLFIVEEIPRNHLGKVRK